MVLLCRAPEPTASWSWEFDQLEFTVDHYASLAVSISKDLQRQQIFELEISTISWGLPDGSNIEFQTDVLSRQRLSSDELAKRIYDCWPAGVQEARPFNVGFSGGGRWMDSSGVWKGDPALVSGEFFTKNNKAVVRLNVHHDAWSERDFFGNLHPEIYGRNAPRLQASLQAVEETLGFPATPGEPTFFGTPYNYGVRVHTAEDGSGIDVSDHL